MQKGLRIQGFQLWNVRVGSFCLSLRCSQATQIHQTLYRLRKEENIRFFVCYNDLCWVMCIRVSHDKLFKTCICSDFCLYVCHFTRAAEVCQEIGICKISNFFIKHFRTRGDQRGNEERGVVGWFPAKTPLVVNWDNCRQIHNNIFDTC